MRRIIFIAIAPLLLSACISSEENVSFDKDKFKSTIFQSYLAFDLRNDEKPAGAIVLRNNLSNGHYKINLNFPVTKVVNKKELLSTSGEYTDFTLIDFDMTSGLSEFSAITFLPKFYSLSEDNLLSGTLDKQVYFVKHGLLRYFIYRYSTGKAENELLKHDRAKSCLELDAIAVLMPEESKGVEIGNSKKTSMPEHVEVVDQTYFFPSKSPAPKVDRIEIRYQIKETPLQKMAVEFLIKLIILLIPAGTALFLMQAGEILNTSARSWGLRTCICLSVLAVGGLAIYSFYIDTSTVKNSIVDIAVLLVGSVMSAFIYYTKRKSTQIS